MIELVTAQDLQAVTESMDSVVASMSSLVATVERLADSTRTLKLANDRLRERVRALEEDRVISGGTPTLEV